MSFGEFLLAKMIAAVVLVAVTAWWKLVQGEGK